jgi:hypothetical protein
MDGLFGGRRTVLSYTCWVGWFFYYVRYGGSLVSPVPTPGGFPTVGFREPFLLFCVIVRVGRCVGVVVGEVTLPYWLFRCPGGRWFPGYTYV